MILGPIISFISLQVVRYGLLMTSTRSSAAISPKGGSLAIKPKANSNNGTDKFKQKSDKAKWCGTCETSATRSEEVGRKSMSRDYCLHALYS